MFIRNSYKIKFYSLIDRKKLKIDIRHWKKWNKINLTEINGFVQ